MKKPPGHYEEHEVKYANQEVPARYVPRLSAWLDQGHWSIYIFSTLREDDKSLLHFYYYYNKAGELYWTPYV